MKAIVKLVVVLLATLWPSVLWADPAVTISWPGSYGRGSLKLTLIANDGTGPVTYTKTVPYGEFSTAGSLAGALGAHISMSPDWPVWAKGYPDGTVLMKARGAGITISNLSVCAIPSGAGDCGSTPSGANLAGNPSNIVPAGVSLDGALYGYSITDTGGNSGYDAAGNITAYQDTVNQRWTLAYDALNRLASASQYYYTATFPTPAAPGGGMQQFFCWVYDSFGNRQRQAVSGTPFSDFSSCNPPGSDSVTVDQQYAGGTNRLTSAPGLAFAYDDAGNIIEDGRFKYLYNEEGKLCAVMANATAPYGATGYLYNAEGQRVAKGSLSSFSCDFSSNGFTMTNEYIPGPDGNMLTEVAWSGSTSTPVRTYAYAGGQLAATLDTNGTHYQLSDWLGSRRVQQKDGSTPAEVTCGNQPFGDGQTCADAVPQHFTGKERDAESGLDYFGARMYSSPTGRFVSPDPSALSSASFGDPQSLNLYAYARNSPLINTDPSGLDCVYMNDGNDGVESIDHASSSGECQGSGGTWRDGWVNESWVSVDKQSGNVNINPSKTCAQGALQAVIHAGETPREPNGGYGSVVRGTVISAPSQFQSLIGTRNAHISDPSALQGHPGILVDPGNGLKPSTAFGRYQITKGTAQTYKITDWSPSGQDAGVNSIMADKGMTDAALSGNYQDAMWDGNKTWASLPDSPYGQPVMTMNKANAIMTNAFQTLPACQ